MKMSYIAYSLLAVCILVSSSKASILGDMLTFDSNIDLANDNSDGNFSDTNGDLIPDLVQGIVWIDSVNGVNVASATGGSIFALYSFTITPTGLPGQFSGVPTPVGLGRSVIEMLSPGAGSADFSNLTVHDPTVGNPAIAIIEVPGSFTNVDWTNASGGGSPLSLLFNGSADLSAFQVDITAGFDGIDDSHTINILAPVPPPLGPIGIFAGVYSIADHIFGSVDYLPVTSPAIPLLFPGGVGDLVIDDGSIGSATPTGAAGRGFNFSDAGTYRLNPTPEPVSLLVWAGLAGIAGLVGSRRHRAAE